MIHEYFSIYELNAKNYVPAVIIDNIARNANVSQHALYLYVAILTDEFQRELSFRNKTGIDAIIEIATAMKNGESIEDILVEDQLISQAHRLNDRFQNFCREFLNKPVHYEKSNSRLDLLLAIAMIIAIVVIVCIIFYFRDNQTVNAIFSAVGGDL